MKSLSRVFGTVAVMVAAGTMLAVVQSAVGAPQQGKATVRSVKGAAEYSSGGAWAPLKPGAILGSGSSIKTGAGSEVILDLGLNAKAIAVTENTTLGIDKLTVDKTGADVVTETQLDVKVGRILGKVNKTSPASRFEIKTPTGVAGIRGTTFMSGANGVVKVKDGCVVVVYVDPSGQVASYDVCDRFKFVPGVGVVPMTDAEMNDPEWNKVTPVGGVPTVRIDGRPSDWTPPLLGVSDTAPTNPPASRPAR